MLCRSRIAAGDSKKKKKRGQDVVENLNRKIFGLSVALELVRYLLPRRPRKDGVHAS